MTIVVHYAPVPSSTTEQYDEVVRRLQDSGELPADGFEYHVAFHADGQLRVTEVWDSARTSSRRSRSGSRGPVE